MRKLIDLNRAVRMLRDFCAKHRRPPSYDEIAALFRYKSKNAAFWLVRKLEAEGVLQRDARGKILLEPDGPRLLGTVQAGFPDPAEEERGDAVSLDKYLVRRPEKTYLVKVTGDSMIDAGIHEGDMVLVEREREVAAGDIVVAKVDGSWTLKYYEKTGKGPVLRAGNPKYPAIRPKEELSIGGVVVGVVRKYK